jgi:L,D-transpeptidase YcbB
MPAGHIHRGNRQMLVLILFALTVLFNRVPAAASDIPQLPLSTSFKLWERSSDVKVLRSLLAAQGLIDSSKTEDNRYDLELMKAVRAFQRRAGLKPTGIPRRETLLALNKMAGRGTAGAAEADHGLDTAAHPKPVEEPAPASQGQTDSRSSTVPVPGPMDAVHAATNVSPMLHAKSLEQMTVAIAHYRAIVAAGGWQRLSATAQFTLGRPNAIIPALRERLSAEQYLPRQTPANDNYDDSLAAALHHFQLNHGLAERDALDRVTLAELNVGADKRLLQLENSLARLLRLRVAHLDLAKEPYVLLNIPAAKVEFVENGQVVSSRLAIAGKPATRSPELIGFIRGVTLDPTWVVPYSIVRKEIAPRLHHDPEFLDRHQMRIEQRGAPVDPATADLRSRAYLVVQKPGRRNSLGLLRIDMPNSHAVYLHGTPQLRLFNSNTRFYSHGCARVQDVVGFAAILLRQTDPAVTKDALVAEIKTYNGGWDPGRTIMLKRPIRVIWAYMTAWVTDDGSVAFRRDIYQRDKAIAHAPSPSST